MDKQLKKNQMIKLTQTKTDIQYHFTETAWVLWELGIFMIC